MYGRHPSPSCRVFGYLSNGNGYIILWNQLRAANEARSAWLLWWNYLSQQENATKPKENKVYGHYVHYVNQQTREKVKIAWNRQMAHISRCPLLRAFVSVNRTSKLNTALLNVHIQLYTENNTNAKRLFLPVWKSSPVPTHQLRVKFTWDPTRTVASRLLSAKARPGRQFGFRLHSTPSDSAAFTWWIKNGRPPKWEAQAFRGGLNCRNLLGIEWNLLVYN